MAPVGRRVAAADGGGTGRDVRECGGRSARREDGVEGVVAAHHVVTVRLGQVAEAVVEDHGEHDVVQGGVVGGGCCSGWRGWRGRVRRNAWRASGNGPSVFGSRSRGDAARLDAAARLRSLVGVAAHVGAVPVDGRELGEGVGAVGLDRQRVVRAVGLDDAARGVAGRVQGVEGEHAAREVDVLEQRAQRRGLAALLAAAAPGRRG